MRVEILNPKANSDDVTDEPNPFLERESMEQN